MTISTHSKQTAKNRFQGLIVLLIVPGASVGFFALAVPRSIVAAFVILSLLISIQFLYDLTQNPKFLNGIELIFLSLVVLQTVALMSVDEPTFLKATESQTWAASAEWFKTLLLFQHGIAGNAILIAMFITTPICVYWVSLRHGYHRAIWSGSFGIAGAMILQCLISNLSFEGEVGVLDSVIIAETVSLFWGTLFIFLPALGADLLKARSALIEDIKAYIR